MSEYYTIESLLSFGGAVVACTLVPTVVLYLGGDVTKPYLKWISFAVALGLAYLGAYLAGGSWVRWIVALFNALVLFLASIGANAMTTPAPDRTLRAANRRMWARW